MTEFNTCSGLLDEETVKEQKLTYERELIVGRDPLQLLLDTQKSLQDKLTESLGRIPYLKDIKTKGQLYDWLVDQKTAIDDEFRELLDAVAGMEKSDKDRSAIWKKWKAKHDEIRNESIESLTDFEKKELLFEAADVFIFYMNIMLALGIDSKDLFVLVNSKISENFNRQAKGY